MAASHDHPVLRRLSKLRQRRDGTMAHLDAQIAAQVEAGREELTMTAMAKRLGMSRDGLYKLLERQRGRGDGR